MSKQMFNVVNKAYKQYKSKSACKNIKTEELTANPFSHLHYNYKYNHSYKYSNILRHRGNNPT